MQKGAQHVSIQNGQNFEECRRELNMFQLRMATSEESNRELNILQFRMANSEECNRELHMFQFRMAKNLKNAEGS